MFSVTNNFITPVPLPVIDSSPFSVSPMSESALNDTPSNTNFLSQFDLESSQSLFSDPPHSITAPVLSTYPIPVSVETMEHRNTSSTSSDQSSSPAAPYDIANVLYPNGTESLSDAQMWSQCEKSLNGLTDHEKYIIWTHHFRPKDDFKFPLVQFNKDSRRCCATMLSNNFVYSQSTNSIYCLPCSLFVPINGGKKGVKDRHQLS